MTNYVCLVLLVALLVKFCWTVAEKWGILEWMQVHAPNEFFHKLLSCEFCRSFHLGMLICIILALVFGDWIFLTIPIFSCNLL